MAIERYNEDGFRIDPLKEKINKKLIELTAEYLLKVKDEIDNYEQTCLGAGVRLHENVFLSLIDTIKNPSSRNLDILSSMIKEYVDKNYIEKAFEYKGEPKEKVDRYGLSEEAVKNVERFFKRFGKKKDEKP